jgi:hypothetical protein
MKNATALRKLTRNFLLVRERWRKGGQEDAPLELPPRWGREGVTLIAFFKKNGKLQDFYRALLFFIPQHCSLANIPICAPEQKNKRNPVIFGRNAY